MPNERQVIVLIKPGRCDLECNPSSNRPLWQEAPPGGRVVHVSRMTTYIDLSDGNVNHATHNN